MPTAYKSVYATLLVLLAVSGCTSDKNSVPATSDTITNISNECPKYSSEDSPEIPQDRADLLVGLTEDLAATCAKSLGWSFRVGSRDDESYALTADYSSMRVTVLVKSGHVSSVMVG
jgi:hypothetical protein